MNISNVMVLFFLNYKEKLLGMKEINMNCLDIYL